MLQNSQSNPDIIVPESEENKRLINFSFKQESAEFQELMTEAAGFYEDGNTKEALIKYVEAHESEKSSVQPFIEIAKIYLETGKLDLAQQNLVLAQKKGPLPIEGKRILARLHLQDRNYQQAREVIQSIKNPTNEDRILLVVLSLLADDIEKARENVDLVAAGTTQDKFQKVGMKLKEAFEIYDTFLDSPSSYLLVLSGENLITIEEYALARPLLFEAISQENAYRDAWVLLGYSYLQSNKLTDAKQTLNKAKDIDPYFAETYFYLGLTQEAAGDHQRAITALGQAEGFGHENKMEIHIHKANNYFALENFPKASEEYEKAANSGKLDMDLFIRAVWINIEPANNAIKALSIAQKALETYPEEAMAFNLVGWAYLANNNSADAEIYLQRAISTDPTLDASYLNLGVLHAQRSNNEVANTYFDKAIKYAEENGSASIKARAELEKEKLTPGDNEQS